MINDLCIGFGWLTIKLKSVRAYTKWDNSQCDPVKQVRDNFDCDPFVELFIDGESQLRTSTRDDTCCYDDLNVHFTSKKISKSATIKIEVWDDDNTFAGDLPPELILRTEGNVDSFLNKGYRGVNGTAKYKGAVNLGNSIDTISFWQDEYKNQA